jgi:hypothetical protein
MPSSIEMRIRWTDEQALSRHFAVFSAQATEVGHRGRSFMTALEWSAMLVPDGPSVRLVSRLMGGAIHDLVTGPEIFFGLSQRLAAAVGRRACCASFLTAPAAVFRRLFVERVAALATRCPHGGDRP